MRTELTTQSKELLQSLVMTPEDALKLTVYLDVRFRDFWLGLHPLIQGKIYSQSFSPEMFFSLVDQEFVRFGQGNKFRSMMADNWGKIKLITLEQSLKLKEQEKLK